MEAVVRVRKILEPLGFDCVVPFSVRRMEAALAELGSPFDFQLEPSQGGAPPSRSPRFAPGSEASPRLVPKVSEEEQSADALGLLIANSRALWEPFQREIGRLQGSPDPLDAYTEACFVEASLEWPDARSFFSHGALGRHLPVQKIADLSGGLPLGPAQLNLHPSYGPWIALRGVLILPSEPAPRTVEVVQSPCLGCSAPCRVALTEALAGDSVEPWPEFSHLSLTPISLSGRAQAFLRVRGVCPAGREHRYSDEQILYHYRRAFSS